MMLSESQERMLMVLKPGKEEMAQAIFEKWELDFAVIGEVTDTQRMVLEWNGEVVCDIPLGPLAAEAPLYERPYLSREDYAAWAGIAPMTAIPDSADPGAELKQLLASPNLASKAWIAQQYDSQVMGDTLQTGGDAAVVRVHKTGKALAISTDCTPRYVFADPYEGGKQAIAEAWRNLCAVGARPLAVTNCLNFANPQRPEIMSQFVHALEGMGDACRALDFPIVSGNVSLYNESKATGGGSAILPTPAIGGVGILEDAGMMVTPAFKAAGDAIYLIAPEFWARPDPTRSHLGKSLWLEVVHGRDEGRAPPVNLAAELGAGQIVRKLIGEGLLSAVHDLSDGGLAVALAEMALAGDIGAEVSASDAYTAAQWWFGEDQARYVVTVSPDKAEAFNRILAEGPDIDEAEMVGFTRIGTVGGDSLLGVAVSELREAYESFFRDWMEG
jgi:phosphoribosylformylglycinamidine synthase